MRALVTATVRLLRASVGGGQEPSPSLSAPELLQEGDPWNSRRHLPDEIQDNVRTRRRPSHGIWIAAATFAPTLLATYFGIIYLAGLPVGTRFPAGPKGGPKPGMSALAPQRDLVATPRQAQAPMTETLGNAAAPATAPAIPRPAPQPQVEPKAAQPTRPTRPQVETKAAQPKRSASIVTKPDAWVRGAAFPDRDSAERLAASLEGQGYPAKVRRGDTPNSPWVVWIGKHPTGVTPSERRK